MRASLVRLSCLLPSVLIASSATAVTMDWTPIGNPGNSSDTEVMVPDGTTGYGSVPYSYNIGTYEVTNAQYAEFLNAKAASDAYGLYHEYMDSISGGITRSGSSGSYTYSAIPYWENKPVNWVSPFDAMRFANWMNNGQGDGDTETGAYTLLGGTPLPSNYASLARSVGATIVIPSEDEWYKSAYFSPSTESYFDYPAGSDTPTTCSIPTTTTNRANCGWAYNIADVGSYPGSPSPYGTFDQGGSMLEWTDTDLTGEGCPVARGGGWGDGPYMLAASSRWCNASHAGYDIGFRVAMLPEPNSEPLVLAGLLGLAGWRRARE